MSAVIVTSALIAAGLLPVLMRLFQPPSLSLSSRKRTEAPHKLTTGESRYEPSDDPLYHVGGMAMRDGASMGTGADSGLSGNGLAEREPEFRGDGVYYLQQLQDNRVMAVAGNLLVTQRSYGPMAEFYLERGRLISRATNQAVSIKNARLALGGQGVVWEVVPANDQVAGVYALSTKGKWLAGSDHADEFRAVLSDTPRHFQLRPVGGYWHKY